MTLGVSSAWAVGKYRTGEELVDKLAGLGLSGVELEYRVTEDTFQEILPLIKKGELRILSLHNIFPMPVHSKGGDPNKRFQLSSLNQDQRKQAVRYAKNTIRLANKLEVEAVVIHAGRTELSKPVRPTVQQAKRGEISLDELNRHLKPLAREWRQKRDKYLDQVLFSLDELNREAIKEGVKLGLENRYYFQEIPSMDQIGVILDEFHNIYYWHDMGHAHVLEVLGFSDQRELLERYSDRLLGIHVHDSVSIDDHKAPGMGEIDFQMVGKYLKDDTIKILEVNKTVSSTEITRGLEFLQTIPGFVN